MTHRVLPALSMIALLALGGCADEPTAPLESSPQAIEIPGVFLSSASLAGTTLPGRYVVSFNGSSTALQAKVEQLGAAVEWVSSGAGLAAVSGLDATGAVELGKVKGVSAIDADEMVSIDEPQMDAALEVDRKSVV